MITARELDLMQLEVDAQMERLMEEFVKSFLGERMGGINGTVHMENGRQPVRPGGEVQYDQRRDIIS